MSNGKGTGARRGHRYRLLTVFGIALALALGSFWLLQVMQNGAVENVPDAQRTEPDYYIEKFNFVRMSKLGEARYNVTGTRMVHWPKDDTYEITKPVIYSLSENQPPLMMRAERAIAIPDSSRIQMLDMVEADRPAFDKGDRFHLSTDYLLILPDDDVMQTTKPVVLTLGAAQLSGIGMYANNATRELRLAQKVRGTYPPMAITGAKH